MLCTALHNTCCDNCHGPVGSPAKAGRVILILVGGDMYNTVYAWTALHNCIPFFVHLLSRAHGNISNIAGGGGDTICIDMLLLAPMKQ